MLVAVLVAAGLYLAGVRRLRRAGQPWPAARIFSFLVGGTGAVVLATMSFLGVYQGVLFSIRAVQNVLLLIGLPYFSQWIVTWIVIIVAVWADMVSKRARVFA